MKSDTPPPYQERSRALLTQCEAIVASLAPGEKLPTVQVLCRDFQTSSTTLNRILGILEARGKIVRRHGVGIFRAAPTSPVRESKVDAPRRVALLCAPWFVGASGASPFWNLLVNETHRRVAGRGDEITVYLSQPPQSLAERETVCVGNAAPPEMPPVLTRQIVAAQVEAVIIVGQSPSVANWLEAQNVPTVAYAGSGRHCVVADETQMYRIAVAQLVRGGCERIGLWFPVTPFELQFARWVRHDEMITRFAEVLREFDLPFDRALVCDNRELIRAPGETTTLSFAEQGYRTATQVFGAKSSHPRPDGLLIADDMMTQGALVGLERCDVPVGRPGLLVATHTNRGLSARHNNDAELIRVETDPAEMVAAISELLESALRADSTPAPAQVVIPFRLAPKI